MIPSEFWILMGVVLGASLGFGFNLLRDYLQEQKQKSNYLGDLLADMKYNKKLADEEKNWGYHTLGYTDAKGAKYLFDLPEELRKKIYDAQTIVSSFYRMDEKMEEKKIRELEKLLKEIIPKLEKHLDEIRG